MATLSFDNYNVAIEKLHDNVYIAIIVHII